MPSYGELVKFDRMTYGEHGYRLPLPESQKQNVGVVCLRKPFNIATAAYMGLRACANGEYIQDIYFCDGIHDCSDGTDEDSCQGSCS